MLLRLLPLLLSIALPGVLQGQDAVVSECAQSTSASELPTRIPAALEAIGGPLTHIDRGWRLCGDSTKWLVLVVMPTRDVGEERGWRFALLVDTASTSVVRYVTRGFIDSYTPDVRVFRSGAEYLLLAGVGDEGGSWGIATYDVGPFVIAELGYLDVGAPAPDPGDNDRSALEAARITHPLEGWRVHFRTKIVLRPNQDTREPRTPPRQGEFTFEPGGQWRLAK